MHSVQGKENKCQESVAIEKKAEKVELQLVSYCQFTNFNSPSCIKMIPCKLSAVKLK